MRSRRNYTTVIETVFGTLRREYDAILMGDHYVVQDSQWYLDDAPISDERVRELTMEALAQQEATG